MRFKRTMRLTRCVTATVAGAAVLALAVAGCSGSGTPGVSGSPTSGGGSSTSEPSTEAEVRRIRIARSFDVLDDTQNVALGYEKQRVEEINASRDDIQIEFDVYDAQSSVDKQLSDVQSALVKKPDVLILSAVDPVGSLPAAQAAHDAGVKLVDRRPSDPEPDVYDVAFFANDEERYTAATKQWLSDYLDENPNVTLKVGLVYGAPAQTAQLARMDVIKELAEERPERVEIVAEGYGNWLTDTAQNLAQDWMQAHPDINYIAAANDIMALGVSNAVDRAGRTGEIMISGYDLTDDGLQRIKDGQQTFDVGVLLEDTGQIIDVAVDLVLGTFTDKTYYIDPVHAVTAENVDEFLTD